jgi:hypothetical protein
MPDKPITGTIACGPVEEALDGSAETRDRNFFERIF